MSPTLRRIFGLHAVSAALHYQAHSVQRLQLDVKRQDARIQALQALAEQHRIPIEYITRAQLDKLAQGIRHQGVSADLEPQSRYHEQDLTGLIAQAQPAPFLLVLDGVQDPHNLGACLRTAAAAGAHAILTPADRAVGLTPTVRKVASGAAEIVPLIQVKNLARTLRTLKEQQLWLVGAAGSAECSLYDVDLSGPLALILGAEQKGLRRLTQAHCDHLVRIPMASDIDSLNVSVAAGVVLFEAVRQRRQSS